MRLPRAPWLALVVVTLTLVTVGLRVRAASRPGLWADEIFSLAMATGHSLEHPAASADTSLGDFREPAGVSSPEALRRYAELEPHPAGAARIVRAVLLSDTSPPLYYLLLSVWARVFGTGDAALRLFSVWWAVLAVPLLWLVGREVGGTRAAWTACALFAVAPTAFYFSVEGRMYSLLWCLVLGLAWATLRLANGVRVGTSTVWVAAGTAGLLTHYFFAFAWVAAAAWLLLTIGSPLRRKALALSALTLVLVLPWYLQVPESLARWRVSGDWLSGSLAWPGALLRPVQLAGSLLAGTTVLGGWRWADRIAIGLLVVAAAWLLRQRALGRLFTGPRLLLWLWLAAACIGPLVFDILRGTTTTEIPRYVLPGLPAAMLLAAVGLSLLPPALHGASLAVLLLAWTPAIRSVVSARVPRPRQPYRALDANLASWAAPGDVVIVCSIPSGVVGVARYLERDIALVPWVVQLGTRHVPEDVERVLAGRRRVAVASIHNLGATDSLLPWLAAHATPLGRDTFPNSRAEIRYFGPPAGLEAFPLDPKRWE